MEKSSDLLCRVRAFMTKEPVPFSTIGAFVEVPSVEIDRLIQHLALTDQDWVRVTVHDLRVVLIEIVRQHLLRGQYRTDEEWQWIIDKLDF